MVYIMLIIVAVATRLLPHAANVAPIGALALFAGATNFAQSNKVSRFMAYSLPLMALFLSDWLIGFYTWQVMAAVYLSFILTVIIGFVVRKYYRWQTIVIGSLAASLLFFLVTNAAVWAFTPLYQKSLAGLLESYTLALPFFRNSSLGDLLYTGIFFGVYEMTFRHNPNLLRIKTIRLANH